MARGTLKKIFGGRRKAKKMADLPTEPLAGFQRTAVVHSPRDHRPDPRLDEGRAGSHGGAFAAQPARPVSEPAPFDSPADVAITGWVRYACVALVCFAAGVLAYQFLAGGGLGAGNSQSGTENQQAASEAASSLAEDFSSEYLTFDPKENSSDRQARLAAFLVSDPQLGPGVVAAASIPAGESAKVLSSDAAYSRPLGGGVWEVRTRNVVELSGKPSPDAATEIDGAPSGHETTTGPTPQPTDGAQKRIERRWLSVYVAAQPGGEAALVAPPTFIAGPKLPPHQAGVLGAGSKTSTPDDLSDAGLRHLLEGFYASYYGRSESRSNVAQFFAPGADLPPPPPEDLDFVELMPHASLYPRYSDPKNGKFESLTEGGVSFAEVYDAELYVRVADAGGLEAIQTQLVVVGKTDKGDWLLVGAEPTGGGSGR